MINNEVNLIKMRLGENIMAQNKHNGNSQIKAVADDEFSAPSGSDDGFDWEDFGDFSNEGVPFSSDFFVCDNNPDQVGDTLHDINRPAERPYFVILEEQVPPSKGPSGEAGGGSSKTSRSSVLELLQEDISGASVAIVPDPNSDMRLLGIQCPQNLDSRSLFEANFRNFVNNRSCKYLEGVTPEEFFKQPKDLIETMQQNQQHSYFVIRAVRAGNPNAGAVKRTQSNDPYDFFPKLLEARVEDLKMTEIRGLSDGTQEFFVFKELNPTSQPSDVKELTDFARRNFYSYRYYESSILPKDLLVALTKNYDRRHSDLLTGPSSLRVKNIEGTCLVIKVNLTEVQRSAADGFTSSTLDDDGMNFFAVRSVGRSAGGASTKEGSSSSWTSDEKEGRLSSQGYGYDNSLFGGYNGVAGQKLNHQAFNNAQDALGFCEAELKSKLLDAENKIAVAKYEQEHPDDCVDASKMAEVEIHQLKAKVVPSFISTKEEGFVGLLCISTEQPQDVLDAAKEWAGTKDFSTREMSLTFCGNDLALTEKSRNDALTSFEKGPCTCTIL